MCDACLVNEQLADSGVLAGKADADYVGACCEWWQVHHDSIVAGAEWLCEADHLCAFDIGDGTGDLGGGAIWYYDVDLGPLSCGIGVEV